MRRSSKYILSGLCLLAACIALVVVFGWPQRMNRTSPQAISLFLIAIGCIGYGAFLRMSEASAEAQGPIITPAAATSSPEAPQMFDRKVIDSNSIPAPSFRFAPQIGNRYFIDEGNGLKLRLYSWPEYNYSLAVEPSSGAQAEAWPLRERAYFEFMVGVDRAHGSDALRIRAAFVHVPFDRDYPGRSEELLDVIVPMVCEVYAKLNGSALREYGPIPDELRPLIKQHKNYVWHQPGAGWPSVS